MADADKAVAEKSYENAAASTVRYKGAKQANKATVELKEADDASPHPAKASPKKPVYKTYQAK
jgi:hypothetical protein